MRVSGSWPSPSSCLHARRAIERCSAGPIRARACSSCSSCSSFGSLALTARLAYWQVVDRERLASEALAQTTITLETPSKRGDVYDRTGTVVMATTVQRERLVAAPDQLTPDRRRATVAELVTILGLDEPATVALRDKLAGNCQVPHHPARAGARGRRSDPNSDR